MKPIPIKLILIILTLVNSLIRLAIQIMRHSENGRYSEKFTDRSVDSRNTSEPRSRPIQGGWLEKDTTTGEVHEPVIQPRPDWYDR